MNRLIAVAPADLGRYWPSIRENVSDIEAPDGFIPEDVYCACKTNGATLFLLEVDGKQVGHMVARLQLPDLHIWQVHAPNGYDVMTTFRDQLMELARSANATKLTFGSTRKAWAQVASKHGFAMRMVVYEAAVEPPKQPVQQPPGEGAGAGNDQQVTH